MTLTIISAAFLTLGIVMDVKRLELRPHIYLLCLLHELTANGYKMVILDSCFNGGWAVCVSRLPQQRLTTE